MWRGLLPNRRATGNCSGEGCAAGGEPTLWGFGRHDFGRVHFYISLAVVALIVLHVALHWSWVCRTTCEMLGLGSVSSERRTVYGTIIILALMALTFGLLYLARLQVHTPVP